MDHWKNLKDCTKKNNKYKKYSYNSFLQFVECNKRDQASLFLEKKPVFEKYDLLYNGKTL